MQVRYIDTFSSIFRENWVSVDEPIYQTKKIAVFHYQIYDDMKNRAYYKSDSATFYENVYQWDLVLLCWYRWSTLNPQGISSWEVKHETLMAGFYWANILVPVYFRVQPFKYKPAWN